MAALLATLKQRLFRWHSDGEQPFRLGQRRIFILPVGSGVLFAVNLLLMLLAAINYNLALGHALVFLLAAIGLVGMLHTFRNLHGLEIAPGRCPPVFAGETARFGLRLGNARDEARPALELRIPGMTTISVTVDAGQQARIELPIATTQRGWLALPRIRLETRYPLGLFVAWSYLQPAMQCLVYPRPITTPLPLAAQPDADGKLAGEGGQEDFSGLRQRQPGDSPRHVAWKCEARNTADKPLLTKLFAGGGQADYRFAWAMTDPALPDDTRLGILTGWVLAASAAGLRFALELPDRTLPTGQGDAHRERCLEALALACP